MARQAIFYLPTGGDAVAPVRAMASRRALAPGEARAPANADPPAVDGVEMVGVVGDGDGPPRSGLAPALERIAAGEARVLVVAHLRDVASTLGELARLLTWLQEADADLIATDLGFDSGEAGARQAVALLREVDRWDREPDPTRRARGRPGLSSIDPELAQRLAVLRESGLSLQAIAGTLNEDGVPTPRGGSEWRPSSVQAALGYRRPRPPARGTPPLPPPPGGGGGFGTPPPPPPSPTRGGGAPPPPPPPPTRGGGAPPPPPPSRTRGGGAPPPPPPSRTRGGGAPGRR
jgi:Recombinase